MSDGSAHETSLSMQMADPAEFDAGTDMALKVRVVCPSACDLRGNMVKIITQGAAIKELGIELTGFDGEATETGVFIVKAPDKPGEYAWTALLAAFEHEGVHHEQGSVTFNFSVKAHQLFVSVWDVPSPVNKGERFTIKIGAKCSAGCSLAELPFTIEDSNSNQVATSKLWKEELAQTKDLYWAEQELVAPSAEGLCEWNARFITSGLRILHEASPKRFPFFAARAPEHVVSVEVVDKDQKNTLKNASIFLDRRRASTDERGIAKIEAAKGTHELHIAKDNYEPLQMTVEVAGDMTIKAEMIFDPDIYSIGNEKTS